MICMTVHAEKEVGAFEAKNRLSELVDEASRGGRIWITKRGRRVALLCSGTRVPQSVSAATLVERFRRIRANCREGTGSIKDLIEDGRR